MPGSQSLGEAEPREKAGLEAPKPFLPLQLRISSLGERRGTFVVFRCGQAIKQDEQDASAPSMCTALLCTYKEKVPEAQASIRAQSFVIVTSWGDVFKTQ